MERIGVTTSILHREIGKGQFLKPMGVRFQSYFIDEINNDVFNITKADGDFLDFGSQI